MQVIKIQAFYSQTAEPINKALGKYEYSHHLREKQNEGEKGGRQEGKKEKETDTERVSDYLRKL